MRIIRLANLQMYQRYLQQGSWRQFPHDKLQNMLKGLATEMQALPTGSGDKAELIKLLKENLPQIESSGVKPDSLDAIRDMLFSQTGNNLSGGELASRTPGIM